VFVGVGVFVKLGGVPPKVANPPRYPNVPLPEPGVYGPNPVPLAPPPDPPILPVEFVYPPPPPPPIAVNWLKVLSLPFAAFVEIVPPAPPDPMTTE